MQVMRKIIEIDEENCDGCGNCVPGCAEGALAIVDGKAKVIADMFCDGLGACIGECPNDALKIIERPADDFDEVAVEKHLTELAEKEKSASEDKKVATPCGCPSTEMKIFPGASECRKANQPKRIFESVGGTTSSAISHWPIQIRLIPPTAPFLKNADLLILADCGGVALANLQEDFVRGRVVMMGCPKFDDIEIYLQRFKDIFTTGTVNSITVVSMEVPCCSGLPFIVQKALSETGRDIPLEEVVVSTRGEILDR